MVTTVDRTIHRNTRRVNSLTPFVCHRGSFLPNQKENAKPDWDTARIPRWSAGATPKNNWLF
jgi:hypothetical protein